MNHKILLAGVATAAMMVAGNAFAGAHASTEDQLKAQGAAIDALSKEVEALKAGGGTAKGVKGVNLKLSGHVNRAVQFVSDGGVGAAQRSSINFVDNDASSSRFRIDADTKTSGGMTIGSRFEIQIESNSTAAVGAPGDSEGDGGIANLRHAYVFVRGGFGTISTGQQSEATDNILHFSYNYASLAHINPEQTVIGAVGANFLSFGDGARQDGVRYDTPSFGGAKLSASLDSDSHVNVAATYSNQDVGGVGVIGAIGYDAAGGNDEIAGSFGLNFGPIALNGASGIIINEGANADNDFFYYVGLAHKGSYSDMGATSIGIDLLKRNGNGDANNDGSVGLGLVQGMAPGADAYASVRHFFGGDVQENATVALVGMRLRF